jgi:hypothetical protein
MEHRTLTMLIGLFNGTSLPLVCGDDECLEIFLSPIQGGPAQLQTIKQVCLVSLWKFRGN